MLELVKWNPLDEMVTFGDRLGRLFEGSLFPALDEEFTISEWRPVVDIYENDDNFVIKADLPGVDKDHIEVDFKDGVLSLKGERSYENEVKEERFYRKERAYGKFQRSFTLPVDVDPEKIKAEFKDGVLKVEIPKPEEKKPKKITVH